MKSNLKVYLNLIKNWDDNINTQTDFARRNRESLENLRQNYFQPKLPTIKTESFRQYGNNEEKMIAWEKLQPEKTIRLVKRPDGIRGIFINHGNGSSNWYNIPPDLGKAERYEMLEVVISITILSFIFSSQLDFNRIKKYLNKEQVARHFSWVLAQL